MQDAIIIEPPDKHQASVIWLHGLGADGHDFEPIVPKLNLEQFGVRFIFPNAPSRPVTINDGLPLRSWYDIRSTNLREQEDAVSIIASSTLIHSYIQAEMDIGIAADHILLAGFSQGGAIALYAGLSYQNRLAGILALSTYLPIPTKLAEAATGNDQNIAIMMMHGLTDPIISLAQAQASYQTLQQWGYQPEWREYPMQHAVCMEQVPAISAWIKTCLKPSIDG